MKSAEALAGTQALAGFGQPDATHQRLVSLIESAHDAIISKDLNGIITSWNRGAERLFGYSAKEVVGKPITILIPQDRLAEEPKILARIRSGERIEHFDTVRRRKDGSLVDISLTVSPLFDTDGRIIGASKIARDVTDRKRAAEALARHIEGQTALYQFTDRLHRAESLDEVYQAALDAIIRALRCERASILLFDAAGVMRFVAWRGLSESYRRAVDGHSPWTADTEDPQPISIDDVDGADLPEALRQTIKAEGIGALAFIPLVTSGRLIGKFMTYYDAPHAFDRGETELAFTLARQLGFGVERLRAEEARRIAEQSLRESEQRLQFALDAGRMGAWAWNIPSGAVVWSPSLQEIHGLKPGAFGGTFDDFKRDIHPDDLPRVLAEIGHAVETAGNYHVTYRMRHPDGGIRWLEAFGRCVPGPDGKPLELAGVCTDISERKRAEAQRELLVAELSHRVKNTLAIVISIARQSFSKTRNDEDAHASFDARIRALAQTHSRLAEANWSGVSLRTIVLDEIAPYRSDDDANVRLEGPSVSLTPKCALTLGMALHELATNAAKYGALSGKDGSVEVSWEVDAAECELRISWSEHGGPAVAPPTGSGFGRLLLERALASDLAGKVLLDFAWDGLKCLIAIPLDDHVVQHA
jgi:PAS domain S-box-containing protein